MTPTGSGTRETPWILKTPPLSSEFEAFRDEALDPPALVVRVGKTELRYDLRCIDDLHAMLQARGDWMPLGAADEQKPAADGTVEAWGRSQDNPVGGWYGLKKGLRGRFGVYVPPCSKHSGWPRSSTTRATTGCGLRASVSSDTQRARENTASVRTRSGPVGRARARSIWRPPNMPFLT